MKLFKDTEGREWKVVIDVTTIKRVRSLINVNLLDIVDGALFQRLVTDPVVLVDIVYCVCKPQADERSISDEQFGQALRGDAIEQATNALLEDLADFFPAGKRQLLKKVLSKMTALTEKADQHVNQRLDGPELDQLLETMLKSSSGDLPESSASTPDPSHSAS